MKMRLLATTVALLQLGAAALPTAAAWANDQERGREHQRSRDDNRDRGRDQRQAPVQRRDQVRPQDQRRDQIRPYRGEPRRDNLDRRRWDRDYGRAPQYRSRWQPAFPFRHGPNYYAPLGRTRYYRDIFIVRPYGHWYSGYGYYYRDYDALDFLAFTAITLAILNIMSQTQQRALENAQIMATTAPIGAPIQWNEGNAYGSVTAVRDGNDSNGRYCREFQQQVTVGNRTETAYGTACRQADGAWQIISTE